MNPKKEMTVIEELRRLYPNLKGRIPRIPVGFNYSKTVLELQQVYSEKFIIEYLDYSHRESLRQIEDGTIPNHLIGEALYALYEDTFGKPPPMIDLQAIGLKPAEQEEHLAYLNRQRKRQK